MSNCQSHQDLNIEHKTKHRKVLLWGNTLVSVIIKLQSDIKLKGKLLPLTNKNTFYNSCYVHVVIRMIKTYHINHWKNCTVTSFRAACC